MVALNLGGVVQILNFRTGALAGKPIHLTPANDEQVSLAGNILLAQGYQSAKVYRADTGEQIGQDRGGNLRYDGFDGRFEWRQSPDGQYLISVANKAARLYSVQTGKRLGKVIAHRQQINSIEFSPDGRWIVSAAADATARIWSVPRGEARTKALQHARNISHAGFNGDGSRIYTIEDRIISTGFQTTFSPRDVRVWNAKRGSRSAPP